MHEETKPQYTPDEFIRAYQELCLKTGYMLEFKPVFVPTNHGTFEIAMEVKVSELKK